MKRRVTLKRYVATVKRLPRRRQRETEEDALYRSWLHTQKCVGREFRFHICKDRFGSPTVAVEQSHIRFNTGMGQKPPEKQSLPMCGALHVNWEEYKGEFVGMEPMERFAWAKPRLDEHHKRFEAR